MSMIINSFAQFPVTGGFNKSNLVAWYDLADVNDAHTGGRDLTNNNTATFVSGHVGNAVDLEVGSTQYLDRADEAAFSFTGDHTFGCWINMESSVATMSIMTKWAGASASKAWLMQVASNNKIQYKIWGTSENNLNQSGAALSDSTWHFIVCTYEAGVAQRIWIDGTLNASDTTSIPASLQDGTAAFEIGSQNAGAATFDGKIDSAFVFSRLLSSTEISTLYNSGAGLAYSDL